MPLMGDRLIPAVKRDVNRLYFYRATRGRLTGIDLCWSRYCGEGSSNLELDPTFLEVLFVWCCGTSGNPPRVSPRHGRW
jgi:hypothetical protein